MLESETCLHDAPHSETRGDRAGQVRPGLLLGRSPGSRGPSERTFETRSEQNEGAQLSNELESARAIISAMVANFKVLEPMVLVTMRPRPSRQIRQTRSEDHCGMFQVTPIVRFLLERGLHFRNLSFCGHDLI
jgi:hypothetical protein